MQMGGMIRQNHCGEYLEAQPDDVFMCVVKTPTIMEAHRGGVALLCSLIVGVGCGGNSRPKKIALPPVDPATPMANFDSGGVYCPNEYISWSLTWKGLRGASTQIIVGEPGVISGRDAIIVRSSSKSSPLATMFREVREELTSEISLDSGRPISNSGDAWEDKDRELTEVKFDASGEAYDAKLSTNFMGGRAWKQSGSTKIHDLHSFMAVYRGWQAKPGTRGVAMVQNGRSLYQVDLAMVGPDSVRSKTLGKTAAIRLQGVSKRVIMDGKKYPDGKELAFTIWRSDDSRRLPLRFEVDTRWGIVRGELVDVRHPPGLACITMK